MGRAAVHSAKKIGAQVIADVRGKDLDDTRSLGVAGVLAIDDDEAIEKFRLAWWMQLPTPLAVTSQRS